MALAELQSRGLLKYLVSQNCDGLHRKSGITSVSMTRSPSVVLETNQRFQYQDRISELHGNSNRECCRDCGKEYIRGMLTPLFGQVRMLTSIRFPGRCKLREDSPRSSHGAKM